MATLPATNAADNHDEEVVEVAAPSALAGTNADDAGWRVLDAASEEFLRTNDVHAAALAARTAGARVAPPPPQPAVTAQSDTMASLPPTNTAEVVLAGIFAEEVVTNAAQVAAAEEVREEVPSALAAGTAAGRVAPPPPQSAVPPPKKRKGDSAAKTTRKIPTWEQRDEQFASVREQCICPISKEPMVTPVILMTDGITYER